MIATVPTVKVFVEILNVAVVAPAATVTDGGTVATLGLLLVNATTAPPAGAAALSVTLPVLFAPHVSVAGFSVIEASVAVTLVASSALEAGGVRIGVGVVVGVGLAVAVGVGAGAGCTSNVPMSIRSFTTRAKPSPRWSSSSSGLKEYGSKLGSPESMAGLPLNSV